MYNQVHELNTLLVPKRAPSSFEKICLERLEVTVENERVGMGKWLSWKRPEIQWYKLNGDGARKGHLSVGKE